MGFKYRRPSVKIGGVRFSKNKKGVSISRKTLLGGRKTYNTGTGKTTTTHKTGIKGLSYQTVSGGFSQPKASRKKKPVIRAEISGQNVSSGAPVKKPLLKRWWLWVIIVFLIWAFASPKPASTTEPIGETLQTLEPTTTDITGQEMPAALDEPKKEDIVDAAEETETVVEEAAETEVFRVLLSWDEAGAYGEQRIINENTDSPTAFIAFFLPTGTYEVRNLNTKGGSQVSVYSGVEYDGKWEQFVSTDCDAPIVVMGGGDAKEIEIKDGQFFKLSDESINIEFVLKQ